MKKWFLSIKNFAKKNIFNTSFLFAFIFSYILITLFVSLFYMSSVSREKDRVISYANSVSNDIKSILTANMNDIFMMEEYVNIANGDIDRAGFDRLAKRMKEAPAVKSVMFAKDDIISYVYPNELESSMVGIDIFNDEIITEGEREALASKKNGTVFIAGPYEAKDGGRIICSVLPINLQDSQTGEKKYWGMAVITVDLDIALKDVDAKIESIFKTSDYLCKVWKVDDFHKDGITIAESEQPLIKLDERNVATVSQNIYGTTWNVAASTYLSWYQQINVFIFAFNIGLISAGLALLYVIIRRLNDLEMIEEIKIQDEIILKQSAEVRRKTEILNVIATEYDCLALIDVNTKAYELYSTIPRLSVLIGKSLEDVKTVPEAISVLRKLIHYDALLLYDEKIKFENIVDELQDKKSFAVELQNINNHYFEIKFVKFEDAHETPKTIALCITQNDAIVRKELKNSQDLQAALERANIASAAKSEFLFSMSHDIRTPMNAIIGFTNMAEKNIDDKDKVLSSLEKVKISSNQLLSLINDILDMSKVESGGVKLINAPVNLKLCIDKFHEVMDFSAQQKNQKFEVSYNCTNSNVVTDEYRLTRILTNVVGNAVKYTDEGGSINLTVTETYSDLTNTAKYTFSVSDNGIGMSKEFISHIFESFSRENSSTISGVQGVGLGMTITKRLVDMMNGTISIDSEEGVGTTVKISFEFALMDDPERGDDALTQSIDKAKDALKGKTVLLVEDNELNREIAKDILCDLGLVVDDASNGIEAIEKVSAYPNGDHYDLILMDIQMPNMGGLEATKRIRNLKDVKGVRSIPIVAMTANASDNDVQKSIEAGMNAHIPKPIKIDVLINTLNYYIK